jgi:hypothetical protein
LRARKQLGALLDALDRWQRRAAFAATNTGGSDDKTRDRQQEM